MNSSRRQFLGSAARLAAVAAAVQQGLLPAFAQAPELYVEQQPFAEDHVRKLAEALAQKPWEDVRIAMPPGWEALTYDQYRDLRFNPDKSFWKDEQHQFSFDLFHSGFLFTAPVDVHVVENGQTARINYSPDLFNFGPLAPKTDGKTDMHYAGLRLRFPINSKEYNDEFAVFQGASYFRGVGKGLLYGLSARGLAVDTGQPTGEEFPMFRAFWVRKPEPTATTIVVEALLDSPSVTGAYKFSIKPGEDTQMDVELILFPRKDMEHVGIAPMTSMFLLNSLSRPVEDFRPAVHDSDGLMMQTGAGEWLWRPLSNHKTLQVSAFIDTSPRGFGLMQRKRTYRDFLDLEFALRTAAQPVGGADRRLGAGRCRALRNSDPDRDQRQYRGLLASEGSSEAGSELHLCLSPALVRKLADRGGTSRGKDRFLRRRCGPQLLCDPACIRSKPADLRY